MSQLWYALYERWLAFKEELFGEPEGDITKVAVGLVLGVLLLAAVVGFVLTFGRSV